jgi:hypothetical protein
VPLAGKWVVAGRGARIVLRTHWIRADSYRLKGDCRATAWADGVNPIDRSASKTRLKRVVRRIGGANNVNTFFGAFRLMGNPGVVELDTSTVNGYKPVHGNSKRRGEY